MTKFNAAFWRWFGDSKVVDENGEPLVVYHGTRARFSSFRTKTDEMGVHFGTKEQAAAFVKKGGHIMPCYLSVQNPLRMKDMGAFFPGAVINQVSDAGLVTSEEFWSKEDFEDWTTAELQEIIIRGGYDGIVYLNRREGKDIPVRKDEQALTDEEYLRVVPQAQDSYIVFSPTQIKSATANRGTWSPLDPDIRRNPATGTCYKDVLMAVVKDIGIGPEKRPLSVYDNLCIVHGQARVEDEAGRSKISEHAWIEFSAGNYRFVYDASLDLLLSKEAYYRTLAAKPEQAYHKPLKLLGVAHRTGHYGPYTAKERKGI